jgi:hypothetical protein
MSDISACNGGSCPLRLHCHRYTCPKEELGQSYFKDPPYEMSMITSEIFNSVGVMTFTCPFFWNNQELKDERPKFENNGGLGEGIS